MAIAATSAVALSASGQLTGVGDLIGVEEIAATPDLIREVDVLQHLGVVAVAARRVLLPSYHHADDVATLIDHRAAGIADCTGAGSASASRRASHRRDRGRWRDCAGDGELAARDSRTARSDRRGPDLRAGTEMERSGRLQIGLEHRQIVLARPRQDRRSSGAPVSNGLSLVAILDHMGIGDEICGFVNKPVPVRTDPLPRGAPP